MSEELKFIKKFQKIKLIHILKKLNIDSSNLYSGKLSNDKEKLIKKEIEKEIAKLYIGDD